MKGCGKTFKEGERGDYLFCGKYCDCCESIHLCEECQKKDSQETDSGGYCTSELSESATDVCSCGHKKHNHYMHEDFKKVGRYQQCSLCPCKKFSPHRPQTGNAPQGSNTGLSDTSNSNILARINFLKDVQGTESDRGYAKAKLDSMSEMLSAVEQIVKRKYRDCVHRDTGVCAQCYNEIEEELAHLRETIEK